MRRTKNCSVRACALDAAANGLQLSELQPLQMCVCVLANRLTSNALGRHFSFDFISNSFYALLLSHFILQPNIQIEESLAGRSHVDGNISYDFLDIRRLMNETISCTPNNAKTQINSNRLTAFSCVNKTGVKICCLLLHAQPSPVSSDSYRVQMAHYCRNCDQIVWNQIIIIIAEINSNTYHYYDFYDCHHHHNAKIAIYISLLTSCDHERTKI